MSCFCSDNKLSCTCYDVTEFNYSQDFAQASAADSVATDGRNSAMPLHTDSTSVPS